MRINFQPLDTLFFRDGKPFSLGDDVWAESVFPCPPSVIRGALRSSIMVESGTLDQANGPKDLTRSLRVRAMGIRDEVNGFNYWPLPRLVCADRDEASGVETLAKLVLQDFAWETTGVMGNMPLPLVFAMPSGAGSYEIPEGAFIEEKALTDLLFKGRLPQQSLLRWDNFLVREPKTGIGIDSDSRTVEKGRLYRVGQIRLKEKYSIWVEVDFADSAAAFAAQVDGGREFTLRLGGDGKLCRCRVMDEVPALAGAGGVVKKGERFLAYLPGAAIFQKGWLPDGIDEATLTGEFAGCQVRLHGAHLAKGVSHGGFEMKPPRPKKMYRAVAAGSVYLLENTGDDFALTGVLTDIAGLNSVEGYNVALLAPNSI